MNNFPLKPIPRVRWQWLIVHLGRTYYTNSRTKYEQAKTALVQANQQFQCYRLTVDNTVYYTGSPESAPPPYTPNMDEEGTYPYADDDDIAEVELPERYLDDE